MTVSLFRQELEGAFHQAAQGSLEDKAQAVADVLHAHGLVRRLSRGWVASTLTPVVSAVWDRSLDDPALAALLACEWFETSLGLNLVSRGLLAGDVRALALVAPPPGAPLLPR